MLTRPLVRSLLSCKCLFDYCFSICDQVSFKLLHKSFKITVTTPCFALQCKWLLLFTLAAQDIVNPRTFLVFIKLKAVMKHKGISFKQGRYTVWVHRLKLIDLDLVVRLRLVNDLLLGFVCDELMILQLNLNYISFCDRSS